MSVCVGVKMWFWGKKGAQGKKQETLLTISILSLAAVLCK